MALCIIPARGGSKRIPGKNIRPFHGRPMIAWSIAAAQASGCFERIVVTTDDPDIARVGRDAGAEVPFLRDPTLADDHSVLTEVIQDAIRRLSLALDTMVCLVYATAPLLHAQDIADGLARLRESNADYAISVTTFPAPVERALVIRDGVLSMLDQSKLFARSQDLQDAYHDAGQFCWGRADAWLSDRRALRAPTLACILPRYRVQDIDTPEDWERAELIARAVADMGK